MPRNENETYETLDRSFIRALRGIGFLGPVDSDLFRSLYGKGNLRYSDLEDGLRTLSPGSIPLRFLRLLLRANALLDRVYRKLEGTEEEEARLADLRDRIYDSLSALLRIDTESGFPEGRLPPASYRGL